MNLQQGPINVVGVGDCFIGTFPNVNSYDAVTLDTPETLFAVRTSDASVNAGDIDPSLVDYQTPDAGSTPR